MPGDYLHFQRIYSAVSANLDLDGSAVSATAAFSVKSSNHRIYVQRVIVSHLTHVDGKVLTIEDSAGTPVKVVDYVDDAENDTTSGHTSDVWIADFGPVGTPLTLGANLNYVANTGGSGFTARVHIEGYQRLEGAVAAASTN